MKLIATLVAVLACASPVVAAAKKGPKITNHVYFDIEIGGEGGWVRVALWVVARIVPGTVHLSHT